MSVMLYPCMFCVALSIDLLVLCVACLTVFVNCLVNQFAIPQQVSTNPSMEEEIKRRLRHGGQAFRLESSIFKSNISMVLKINCVCIINAYYQQLLMDLKHGTSQRRKTAR